MKYAESGHPLSMVRLFVVVVPRTDQHVSEILLGFYPFDVLFCYSQNGAEM